MSHYCVVCEELKVKEPLCKYSTKEGIVNVCSYGCWCRRNSHKLTYEHLLNKEDFQDPIPFVTKNTAFSLKTNGELDQMTSSEVTRYLEKLEDYMILNPHRLEIQLKELNNNETFDDTDQSTDDDLFTDDY